ncbi:MAG: Sialic acid TRAP transporter permease protein SiaT [Syntrophaceae bacterium PtaB.Bin038]|nr:MAG: Sialic acid TRAP transporter permease protein SiaT [Syntrophaceae bacterium PtaB.Bin038]
MGEEQTNRWRGLAINAVAILLVSFVLYTCATGPFEGIINRAVFVGILIPLGVLMYPLWRGTRLRPLGIAVDASMALGSLASCAYVIVNYEEIMLGFPTAQTIDLVMTVCLVVTILEISRRAIGLIFPVLVVAMLVYALLGEHLPGRLGHRGFDIYFVTETLFLGDLGIWGMLTGVAATVIAAFTVFGAVLLNTGGGQTFIDIAMRTGGRAPGGGAKIATIASGLFGMVSGSAVANVATTGNFTIPLMKRLKYPPAMAGGTEAIASTGGQLAPPIMGAAAFIMAEIIGVDYARIIVAAALPAFLFYLGVFMTIHVLAIEGNLGSVPDEEVPGWKEILRWERVLPIGTALTALFYGILSGSSITTAAFYGILGALITFPLSRIRGRSDLFASLKDLNKAVSESASGLLIIGILLAGAQIMVSAINMTGLGVTLSTLIIDVGGENMFLITLIVAVVCMIMGMGIPTTAAYVLVAAVLAPAMIKIGIAPLVSHMFVFYYATLSVVTPPVCIAVFVAAGIAGARWGDVAKYALRLGAVTYIIPFLFILYPGMLAQGGWPEFTQALFSGVVFVVAFASLFGGMRTFGSRIADVLAWLVVAGLAVMPGLLSTTIAVGMTGGLFLIRKRFRGVPRTTVSS